MEEGEALDGLEAAFARFFGSFYGDRQSVSETYPVDWYTKRLKDALRYNMASLSEDEDDSNQDGPGGKKQTPDFMAKVRAQMVADARSAGAN